MPWTPYNTTEPARTIEKCGDPAAFDAADGDTPALKAAAMFANLTRTVEAKTAELDTKHRFDHAVIDPAQRAVASIIRTYASKIRDTVRESDEVLFVRKYRQPSEVVRAEYVARLEANSFQGGTGHDVRVTGYNARGAHHWVLRCGSYAHCQPTERELDAFRVIRGQCEIAPKPHTERWGN